MKYQTHSFLPLANKTYQIAKRLVVMVFILGSIPEGFSQEKRAKIDVIFSDTDSVKLITAMVQEQHPQGVGDPIEGLDLYFYVQRSFSLLPIGSVFNTTDESGKVEVEFPAGLPGDEDGNVVLLIKIEDSPPYRDTSLQTTISWGVPLVIDEKQSRRSLWASRANAPMSLVFLVNSILLVVWGLIVYIIFQLYLIYKETSISDKNTAGKRNIAVEKGKKT